MSSTISSFMVKNELDGLLGMYDESLADPSLSTANIHVQLAFTIANIRSEYSRRIRKPKFRY